ncbi:MAG: patatin-like phospholipase family protein, partial [Bacteroidales bacterium]
MKKNIALVLSGGGARGIAHIGVINELQNHGYKITSIAGTSMGALVGGIFATGDMPSLEKWLKSLDLMEVVKLTDFSISNKGLIRGNKVIKRMKEIIPDRNIEDLPLPYCAVATDIINGTEKVFDKGNLYDAIRASISIPTIFRPYKIGRNYYVDGGVLNPIPVNHVERSGNDSLVVVDVNAFIPAEEPEEKKNEIQEKQKSDDDHTFIDYLNRFQHKLSNIIPKNKNDEIGMFNLTNKSIGLMLHKISSLLLEVYK